MGLSKKERVIWTAYEQTRNVKYIADLFEHHRQFFLAYLRKNNFPNPEDTLQEGYIKIHAAIAAGKFNPANNSTLRTWLLQVILNCQFDALRKLKKEKSHHAGSLDQPIGENKTHLLSDILPAEEPGLEYNLTQEEIPTVIGLYELIETPRSALMQTAIHYRLMGLQFNQIEAYTGINQTSLRVSWRKARIEIRRMFDKGLRNPNFTHQHLLDLEINGDKIKAELESKPKINAGSST